MTTQQNDAMAMTDQELEQVQGGILPFVPVVVKVGAGLVIAGGLFWGAGKVNDALDKAQDTLNNSKQEK